MLFLACLDLTFALVLTLNIFPLAVPNKALPPAGKAHKHRHHSTEQCNREFATCFSLLSKDGGFLGQVLYGRGDYSKPVQERLPETITHYCQSLGEGLTCVESALRGCSPLIEKEIIRKVRIFMRSFRQIDLCTKTTYREGLSPHYCLDCSYARLLVCGHRQTQSRVCGELTGSQSNNYSQQSEEGRLMDGFKR